MTSQSTQSEQELRWPSVETAYDFVLPSYQMLIGRFEAADNRIVALMTMASSFTLAAPILARAVRPDISFSSRLFISALAVFGVIILGGLMARLHGVLTLPDPGVIRERSLVKSPWQFKSDAIFFAAKHFDANARAITVKANWSSVLTGLLAIETALLVGWIAR